MSSRNLNCFFMSWLKISQASEHRCDWRRKRVLQGGRIWYRLEKWLEWSHRVHLEEQISSKWTDLLTNRSVNKKIQIFGEWKLYRLKFFGKLYWLFKIDFIRTFFMFIFFYRYYKFIYMFFYSVSKYKGYLYLHFININVIYIYAWY